MLPYSDIHIIREHTSLAQRHHKQSFSEIGLKSQDSSEQCSKLNDMHLPDYHV